MTHPRIELADIIRQYGSRFLGTYGGSLPYHQLRVLTDIARCRTAALDGHVEACPACGFERISYNSCRNRHCPKCQSAKAAEWAIAREADLLPVNYFHVVFTLPDTIAPLALQNKRLVYHMLFQAAARTCSR